MLNRIEEYELHCTGHVSQNTIHFYGFVVDYNFILHYISIRFLTIHLTNLEAASVFCVIKRLANGYTRQCI